MREIYPLKEELGLLNMGIYSAGFNAFVDNLVFPMTMGVVVDFKRIIRDLEQMGVQMDSKEVT
jgi:hypothetical protein